MLKLTLATLLLLSSPLYASVCPSDVNSCCAPCSDLSGLLIGAEGLYWTANQHNLDYALDIGNDGFLASPGKTHSLNYDWNYGVRGWFGIHCDGGEGRFVYTWIQVKAEGSTTNNPDSSLSALLIHPGTERINALEAEGENSLEYQTLDMLYGNNLSFCCDKIWIRPFYGARALKIYQKLDVLYEGLDFEIPGEVTLRSKLLAAGINAGFDMQYKLEDHLGIYGGFGGSVLAGKVKAEQRQYIVGIISDTDISLDDNFNVCIPGYQFTAGLSWHFHCIDYCDFVFKLGYEFSHWFNVPTTRRFYDSVNHGVSESLTKGELTLHGATITMLFAF
jgi:hypothetical protein